VQKTGPHCTGKSHTTYDILENKSVLMVCRAAASTRVLLE